jgi:hypothetical protein
MDVFSAFPLGHQRSETGTIEIGSGSAIFRQHLCLHRFGFVRPTVDVGKRLPVRVAHHLAPAGVFSMRQGTAHFVDRSSQLIVTT